VSYVALYREWRPQTFAEVVGQEHITRTLQNAVRLGRLGHAYLLAGPRGTGKTSVAKILAKAANCTERGDSPDPCNQCPSCGRINSGASVDVLEIDAASNRGIDEIRELRDKVKYAPAESKRKVYIIDEVHMLTNEAFNALLKTLEEPPGHALFILATTDPQKIPLTVLSRCQRFDFHRLSAAQIQARLEEVAGKGKLQVDERALALVARAAEGGLRDALSLLDQLVAFCGNTIQLEDALAALGLAPSELLADMALALARRDATTALRLVDQVMRQGKDIRQFLRDLMGFLRNALLLQVCGDGDQSLVDAAPADLGLLGQAAGELSGDRLPAILATLAETESELKWSSQPRLLVELALVKLCSQAAQPQPAMQSLAETTAQPAASTPTAVQSAGKNQPAAGPKPSLDRKPAESGPTPEAPTPAPPPGELTLEAVVARWPEVLRYAKESRPLVYQMLSKGIPVRLEQGRLYIQFAKGLSTYDRGQMSRGERRAVVEEAVSTVLGASLSLAAVVEGSEPSPRPRSEPQPVAPQEDPAVKRVLDFFGGEVVEIRKDS